MMAAAVIMYGCAGGNGSSAGKAEENQQGIAVSTDPSAASRTVAGGPESGTGQQVVTSPTSVAIPVDARPAALVNGKTVDWGELRPLLNEAAGAEVLREIVLDRRIGEALAASRVTISADDVAGERRILLEELDPNPNHAVRLLDELRDRQKLGPQRFERLLRRNAALRKLAADRVEVTEMMLREQFDVYYGPTRQARIIVTPTLGQAEAAISEVRSGASFADVATRRSSDLSAARGGLLEPISVSNQLYAKSLRDALWALPPGEISNPIMVDNRFAVLQLVSENPAFKADFDTERQRLERIVRLAQERLVMDQLARQMMADNSVTIFDESLNQAWDAARRRPKQP
jgi:hypothetical protein